MERALQIQSHLAAGRGGSSLKGAVSKKSQVLVQAVPSVSRRVVAISDRCHFQETMLDSSIEKVGKPGFDSTEGNGSPDFQGSQLGPTEFLKVGSCPQRSESCTSLGQSD